MIIGVTNCFASSYIYSNSKPELNNFNTIPSQIPQGKAYFLNGTITSSTPITKVTIRIFSRLDWGAALNVTECAYPHSYSYNLANIDPRLHFTQYPAGDMEIQVWAVNSSGAQMLHRGEFEIINTYRQNVGTWASHPYGKGQAKDGTYWNATIQTSGCGILSVVNAVYHLNGQFINPVMLADFALANKCSCGKNHNYRINGSGTCPGILKGAAQKFRDMYGFKYEKSTTDKATLIECLNKGQTAIWHCPGHFMTISEYDKNNDKFLIINSQPGAKFSSEASWQSFNTIFDLGINSFYLVSKK